MFTRDQVGPLRTLSEADRAWTDGMLMASDMPLEQFLQELGRYRRGHLAAPAVLPACASRALTRWPTRTGFCRHLGFRWVPRFAVSPLTG